MAECKIAAESIQEVVSNLNMQTAGKSLILSYLIAILNTLESILTQSESKPADKQILNESFIILLSLVVHKLPKQILSQYFGQVNNVLKKEQNLYGSNSLAISKFTLPVFTKLFIVK